MIVDFICLFVILIQFDFISHKLSIYLSLSLSPTHFLILYNIWYFLKVFFSRCHCFVKTKFHFIHLRWNTNHGICAIWCHSLNSCTISKLSTYFVCSPICFSPYARVKTVLIFYSIHQLWMYITKKKTVLTLFYCLVFYFLSSFSFRFSIFFFQMFFYSLSCRWKHTLINFSLWSFQFSSMLLLCFCYACVTFSLSLIPLKFISFSFTFSF